MQIHTNSFDLHVNSFHVNSSLRTNTHRPRYINLNQRIYVPTVVHDYDHARGRAISRGRTRSNSRGRTRSNSRGRAISRGTQRPKSS